MVQNLCSRLIQPKASSSRGLSWPRGFGMGFFKPRLILDVKVFRINALKRCPRLAEAVNDCCACSVFNYIPAFTAERRALQWRKNEFCLHLHLQSGKWRIEIHVKKKCVECPRRKTNPAHMQRAWDCGDISMKPLNGSLSKLSSGFSHKFPNFLWPINYLGTQQPILTEETV